MVESKFARFDRLLKAMVQGEPPKKPQPKDKPETPIAPAKKG